MRVSRAIPLLALLMLAGCGTSPKTHYFTLSALPEQPQAKVAIKTPVTVSAVHVPPSLDRREMVRRTGPNTVAISNENLWTAPLGEMTRQVLSRDLAARLRSDQIVLPDAPSPPGTARIVVSIAQFGSDSTGNAVLDGSWSLLEGKQQRPELRREVKLTEAIQGGAPGAEAAAMSKLLHDFATQIIAALSESS
jgi:uncharacterized lipoprotein YmbA